MLLALMTSTPQPQLFAASLELLKCCARLLVVVHGSERKELSKFIKDQESVAPPVYFAREDSSGHAMLVRLWIAGAREIARLFSKAQRAGQHAQGGDMVSATLVSLRVAQLETSVACLVDPGAQCKGFKSLGKLVFGIAKSAVKFWPDPAVFDGIGSLLGLALETARRALASKLYLDMALVEQVSLSFEQECGKTQRDSGQSDGYLDQLQALQARFFADDDLRIQDDEARKKKPILGKRWEAQALYANLLGDLVVNDALGSEGVLSSEHLALVVLGDDKKAGRFLGLKGLFEFDPGKKQSSPLTRLSLWTSDMYAADNLETWLLSGLAVLELELHDMSSAVHDALKDSAGRLQGSIKALKDVTAHDRATRSGDSKRDARR